MSHICVIGGGAAGMMAAYAASCLDNRVTIIEKNEKLGKKIYITGKGRCNLTNMCDSKLFMDNICVNQRFFRNAYKTLNNSDTYNLFQNLGLSLKTERGNRVFPVSDKASDVTTTLQKALIKNKVDIIFNRKVISIGKENELFSVKTDKNEIFKFDKLILACGGLSYPSTGSSGDGYKLAGEFGHNVKELYPSLVALNLKEKVSHLQGLSLKNVNLKVFNENKCLYDGFGEMLFTNKGISGPIVLSASTVSVKYIKNGIRLKCIIDLKPALSEEQLYARLDRESKGNESKHISTLIHKLVPKILVDEIIRQAKISEKKQYNSINDSEMKNIIKALKELTFTINDCGGYNEAVVTRGGIDVKDINSASMESKLCNNLYFAGEMIDLDAYTGGFNLQIAWSTGYTAGLSAGSK